jgi:hypothetical protein
LQNQDDFECSWVESYSFDFIAMINNKLDRAWRFFLKNNIVQSRCANLLETWPKRLTALITAKRVSNMHCLRGWILIKIYKYISFFYFDIN